MSPVDSPPEFDTLNETKDLVPDMPAFRTEIGALIAERKEKYIDMIELLNVDPEDLTEEDASMWYKVNHYKKGLISPQQFKEEYKKRTVDSKNDSRINFALVLSSKLQALWANEDMDEEIEKRRI